MKRFMQLSLVGLFVAFAASARADIFEWEYINPGDPVLGKQQSTTLAPDGAGVDAVSGVYLANRNLTMAYLIGEDLTGAYFYSSTLTNADFTYAELTGADLTGARVQGARFTLTTDRGFTAAQLYSTASYQARDLTRIDLRNNNLSGWNLAGQNLTKADFSYSQLTNANLSQANLTNAQFIATGLFGADLTGADTRGAYDLNNRLSYSATTNLILPNGHISGLDLDGSGMLVVRDYDGNPSLSSSNLIPITIDQHFAMSPDGTLRMLFEADAWDSTISFAAGIPVSLGGTLELMFADGTNIASQRGRTFQLFDWTGVTPTGAFNVESPYVWNLSNLYSTGEVTLTAVPEPATFAMVVVGSLCLAVHRRRQNP